MVEVEGPFIVHMEDPGAYAFMEKIPGVLSALGYDVRVVLEGPAKEMAGRANRYDASMMMDLEAALLTRPTAVLVGASQNPQGGGVALIKRCNALGGRSIGVVDTAADLNIRFKGSCSDSADNFPQTLLVADETSKNGYGLLGVDAEQVHVVGHPVFDTALGQRQSFLSKRAARQVRGSIAFIGEHNDLVSDPRLQRDEDYTLFGWGESHRRVDIVLESFIDASEVLVKDMGWRRILRLHPKNHPDEFERYAPYFCQIQSGGEPYQFLEGMDIVVGMNSTLMVEASILGIPTLSLLPKMSEREWTPVFNDLCLPACVSIESATEWLHQQAEGDGPGPCEMPEPKGALGRIAEVISKELGVSGRHS